MTSKERDDKHNILLQKNKEIQDEIDIIEAEAKANSEAREHNKNEIHKLDSEKKEMGLLAHASSIFGFGHIPYINKKLDIYNLNKPNMNFMIRNYEIKLEHMFWNKKIL